VGRTLLSAAFDVDFDFSGREKPGWLCKTKFTNKVKGGGQSLP
jgi:hypothetical protein